ncbi:unnamed protein product [Caenorhabditis brenneri]
MGFHIYGGTIMMFTVHNTFDFSNFGVWVLFGICSICAGCVLLILCTQFVYRYFAMNHSKNLKFFTGWRRLFLVILTLFVSIIYGACGSVGINSTPEKDLRIRQAMADAYGVSPDAVHYMGIEYFERKETNEIVVNWISIGAALVVNCYFRQLFIALLVQVGYGVHFASSDQTPYNFMDVEFLEEPLIVFRSKKITVLTMSILKKKQIKTFQTLTPTVFIFIPCMVFYVVPLFEYPMGVDSNIVSISLVTYPMIDPIGVMFIIKNYRTFVKKMLTIKFCCNNKTASQPEGLIQVKAISENNESLRFNSIQGG